MPLLLCFTNKQEIKNMRHALSYTENIFVKKLEKMNEYLFLGGLTLTLFAGLYFVKTLMLTGAALLKEIVERLAE
ncbi:MAG: hypothetical protein IPO70_11575 [Bacteroidetes bacterium]|nr:hypothetical protein [Bacteroidota bacterium]MBK9672864.1 hypothetical protein [Bacteroidota bacterium]